MRMTDIIKLKTTHAQTKPSYIPRENADTGGSGLQMKKLITQRQEALDDKKTLEDIYQQYMRETRSIFNRAAANFEALPPKSLLQELAAKLISGLQLSSADLIAFFMRCEGDNYLYSHSVNVTFLSVMVGIWLNYNRSDLNRLAIASMLHDIGMLRVLGLALSPKKLSPTERKEIEAHPDYSIGFIKQIPEMDTEIIEAVHNHHNRLSRSKSYLNEYSQVIGLVDTFEAMTHPRVYKPAQEPSTAVRVIIDELRGQFSANIIKAMIDNIGIYPVGTWVRLDTKEIGLVIDINPGSPLSPKINILFNKAEERLPEPRTVDLARHANIRITNPLEEGVKLRIKEALQSN